MTPKTKLVVSTLAETEDLAERLSPLLRAGDIIALEGDLGAGKSAFARSLIRHYFADPAMDVPSPTFTIVQTYGDVSMDEEKVPLWHADLYRLSDADELYELGLDDARDGGVLIVEWPDRMEQSWQDNALTLHFEILPAGDDVEELPRAISIVAPGSWLERIEASGIIV